MTRSILECLVCLVPSCVRVGEPQSLAKGTFEEERKELRDPRGEFRSEDDPRQRMSLLLRLELILLLIICVLSNDCPYSLSSCATSCFGDLECIEHDEGLDYVSPPPLPPVIPLQTILDLVKKHSDAILSLMNSPNAWPVDDFVTVQRHLIRLIENGGTSNGPTSPAQFTPFVQKVVIPAGAQVAMFGDLHGSVHSFLRELLWLQAQGLIDDDLRVRPEHATKFFAVFHGDYVDRGPNGIETLALVIAFRLANPRNVFIARGNHESREMNVDGGFADELSNKYADSAEEDISRIYALYDALPVAVFLGVAPSLVNNSTPNDTTRESGPPTFQYYKPSATQFLLCVHGGLEVGFDPVPLLLAGAGERRRSGQPGEPEFDAPSPTIQFALISALRRGDWLRAQPDNVRQRINPSLRGLFTDLGDRPLARTLKATSVDVDGAQKDAVAPATPARIWQGDVGFMWNDFFANDVVPFLSYSRGRGFIFGRDFTRHWLEESSSGLVAGVVRAHQHNNARASGPMLSEVRAAGGVFDNWANAGLVVTLLSGGSIPGLGFPYDAFALLAVPSSDAATWRMQVCNQRSEQPFLKRRGQWVQLAGDASASESEQRSELPSEWGPHMHALRVCSPGIAALQCRDTPWRAGARAGRGAPRPE